MAYSILGPTQRVFDALLARLEDRIKAKQFPKLERSYLTLGDIDFPTRCSQFAVSARRVYPGAPGIEESAPIRPHAGYQKFSLEIGVAYTRCWPVKDGILEPAKETRAGTETLGEVDVVLEEVVKAYYAGELTGDCFDAQLGAFVLVGPMGGVAGVTVPITVQLM